MLKEDYQDEIEKIKQELGTDEYLDSFYFNIYLKRRRSPETASRIPATSKLVLEEKDIGPGRTFSSAQVYNPKRYHK